MNRYIRIKIVSFASSVYFWSEIFPLHDSRFRSWAAGDCYLVYPGSSSIRMERLVEGIQDAEKIRILRKEFAENGEVAKLKKLNQTVSGFMPEKLNGQNASQMVRNGRKLLSTF